MAIQRRNGDHIEINEREVSHSRTGKHVSSMTTNASQPHNRNVCIFNALLSFRSKEGNITDKLLAVEFLFGNGYTSKGQAQNNAIDILFSLSWFLTSFEWF